MHAPSRVHGVDHGFYHPSSRPPDLPQTAPTNALPKGYHDRHVNQWSGDGGFIISYYIRQDKFINFVCVRQQSGWTEQSWSVPSNVAEMLAAFPNAGEKLRRMMAEANRVRSGGNSRASTRRNGRKIA
jgi:hypothetical protein